MWRGAQRPTTDAPAARSPPSRLDLYTMWRLETHLILDTAKAAAVAVVVFAFGATWAMQARRGGRGCPRRDLRGYG